MLEVPLPVAIAALIHDQKILLIKRARGNFVGLWGLPGGKVEKQEHVSDAAIREIKEETGLTTIFKEHLGFVSEHLVEDGVVLQHFLLHLCQLQAASPIFREGKEGALRWFPLADLEQYQGEIIPSDYSIIRKIVLLSEKNYYNCIIEKSGENYVLRKFE